MCFEKEVCLAFGTASPLDRHRLNPHQIVHHKSKSEFATPARKLTHMGCGRFAAFAAAKKSPLRVHSKETRQDKTRNDHGPRSQRASRPPNSHLDHPIGHKTICTALTPSLKTLPFTGAALAGRGKGRNGKARGLLRSARIQSKTGGLKQTG